MFRKSLIALACGAALLGAAGQALASSTTTTFNATATVNKACVINSASTLAFGVYDPTSATATDATSAISLNCTLSTAYTIGLNAGTTAGGSTTTRKMTDGTGTLDYTMSQDAPRSVNWGNAVGTDTKAGSGAGINAAAQTHTVYGRVAALQDVPAGSFSDTVTVTVTY